MRARLLPALATLAALTAAPALAAVEFPFSERFDAGADARWQLMTGDWSFADGRLSQASEDYDCGAAVAVRPRGAYTVAVRFTPESPFIGGGLFFGLPRAERKHGGMMVRLDPGGRVLWGQFSPGGEFEFGGDADVPEIRGEQELAVAVDPGKSAFNILHNGKIVARNVATHRTRGFTGLQTSGGPHTFTGFDLRPATPAELAGLAAPHAYSSIVSLVGDERSIVALRAAPQLLARFDGDGKLLAELAAEALPGLSATDPQPIAVAWDRPTGGNAGRGVLVLVADGKRLYRLDADLKPVGDGPLVQDDEMSGRGLTVDAAGYIFVTDRALPGIRVFDADGKPVMSYGEKGALVSHDRPTAESAGKFSEPRGIAIAPDGLIVVADRLLHAWVAYRFDAAERTFAWVTNSGWLPMPEGVAFDRQGQLLLSGTFEYYRAYGALRVMTRDAAPVNVFVGHALGDMSDKVRACEGPGGRLYLADPAKNRVIVLPPDFVEPLPEFAWEADGGVKLTMTKVDGTRVTTTSNERLPDNAQRVIVRQREPVAVTWPPAAPESLRSYVLPEAPPAGQTYVIDMPVLVAVFTQATLGDGKEVKIAPEGIAARLARELEKNRTFYWLNSYAKLNKQFEIMVIDEVPAKLDGAWITPGEGRRLVNEARRQRGLPEVDGDHSLVCIHPTEGFDPAGDDDGGSVGGGGLTVYAYSGYALYSSGQAWLMGHEWGHQLDNYFDRSGFPDWWLNHPDGSVHVGRYGEHWDCNAFLCRRADPMNWLRFRYGTLRLVADADGDGLPDRDPTLPMDEARFGSDPTKVDTDGDGLTDLQELMAGTFTSSDPRNPDTDENGTPDGQDPHPQFAVARAVRSLADAPDLTPLGTWQNHWADADLAVGYSADEVVFRATLRKPARTIFLPIDWNNDGWFAGRDNLYYSVELEWRESLDGATPPTVSIRRKADCTADVRVLDDAVEVTVRIARPDVRAPLAPGSSLGLIPRLQLGGGTGAFLIDPWQVLGVELK